ncbi:MAG: nucleotidyl transferase AbiEii/AbiGii toxin family protein [Planctomycetota bacterium]|nr:nucleotidyl transferase AbiEii/AbiGii toxin family protein [Planctomycetota bacterium]
MVEVQYPAGFKLNAIRPQVKLEIGPLASWVPSASYSIRPYVAESFPKLFTRSVCNVTAITAERTFWEKATILHQQSHRTTTMPSGYSRHYYDMVMLASSSVKTNALGNLPLLREVVEFKQRFYRSGWARYDLATPGTFRLLPNEAGEKSLRDDYRAMRPMFFSEPPSWDAILASLEKLEKEINSL